MGARRRAREHALMILYSVEMAELWPDTAVERFYDSFGDHQPLDPPPSYAPEEDRKAAFVVRSEDAEARAYATELVQGVGRGQEALDQEIRSISKHWRLDRMASVDRTILRIATFELTEGKKDVPRKVAINEAIELAKRFGSTESKAFVNGILDRIGKKAS